MIVTAKVAWIWRRQTCLLRKLGGGTVHIVGVPRQRGKEGKVEEGDDVDVVEGAGPSGVVVAAVEKSSVVVVLQ